MSNSYKRVSKPSKADATRPAMKSRYSWVGPIENKDGVTWAAVDQGLLLSAITAVSDLGDAIRLSLTSGGFALSLVIYSGDTPSRWATASSDDMNVILERIIAVCEETVRNGG